MRPPPLFQNHRGFSSFFRQIDLQDLYITLGSGLEIHYVPPLSQSRLTPRSRLSKLGRTVGGPRYRASCSQVADGLEQFLSVCLGYSAKTQ